MDYLGDITTFTSLLVVCSKTPNFQQIGPRPLRHRYKDAQMSSIKRMDSSKPRSQ